MLVEKTENLEEDQKVIKTKKGFNIFVSPEDYEKVKRYSWQIHYGYAVASAAKKKLGHYSMHRLIMGKPPNGLCVDHINGNKLDNRRSNLRFVSYQENGYNRKNPNKNNKSGATGVHWCNLNKKWRATISLGLFKSKEEAIEARRKSIERILKNVT